MSLRRSEMRSRSDSGHGRSVLSASTHGSRCPTAPRCPERNTRQRCPQADGTIATHPSRGKCPTL
eukprot:3524292-Lingulodinium_polyedra.AAC.1